MTQRFETPQSCIFQRSEAMRIATTRGSFETITPRHAPLRESFLLLPRLPGSSAKSHSMFDICCIGHLTHDKVVTTKKEVHMAGGTSFYFSNAIRNMDLSYGLVTALGQDEIRFAHALREKGI